MCLKAIYRHNGRQIELPGMTACFLLRNHAFNRLNDTRKRVG